jgi:3-oxoacyl-[acyl-carrier protein] reductase
MFTSNSLENKTAWVTGASRGIGRAIALQLGKMGATVIGTATTQEGADEISRFFEQEGIKGRGKKLNVCDKEQCDELHEAISKEFGAPSILVNNAGITRDNLLVRMKEEEWNEVMLTNLTSIYRLSKLCAKDMMRARWGRIVNISSIVGTTGNPGQANYSAAKAGLMGFTKSLAQELGSRNVTVNVVAPGFIDTDMTRVLADAQRDRLLSQIPLGRLGEGSEIANAVAFLVSDLANYISGQTLHVNGGLYMGS